MDVYVFENIAMHLRKWNVHTTHGDFNQNACFLTRAFSWNCYAPDGFQFRTLAYQFDTRSFQLYFDGGVTTTESSWQFFPQMW